jgi:hypothetical protein
MYGSKKDFHDITDVVTARSEHFFEEPVPNWDQILKGPEDRIAFLRRQLSAE